MYLSDPPHIIFSDIEKKRVAAGEAEKIHNKLCVSTRIPFGDEAAGSLSPSSCMMSYAKKHA